MKVCGGGAASIKMKIVRMFSYSKSEKVIITRVKICIAFMQHEYRNTYTLYNTNIGNKKIKK